MNRVDRPDGRGTVRLVWLLAILVAIGVGAAPVVASGAASADLLQQDDGDEAGTGPAVVENDVAAAEYDDETIDAVATAALEASQNRSDGTAGGPVDATDGVAGSTDGTEEAANGTDRPANRTDAAAAGARDGLRLAEEQGVDVSRETELTVVYAAVAAAEFHANESRDEADDAVADGTVADGATADGTAADGAPVDGAPADDTTSDGASASTDQPGATVEAVRAAATGASHGAVLQHRRSNATELVAPVMASTAGALSQSQSANGTQLQAAAYGAAHGTVAHAGHANVTQLALAAYGGSAGATWGAAQANQTTVSQIRMAAQGGAYGSLVGVQRAAVAQRQTANATQTQAANGTQIQTANGTQILAAAFGAASGGAGPHDADSKQVQAASMAAAQGALAHRTDATFAQVRAAARGAAEGALARGQRATVLQLQQVATGAAEGAISQHRNASAVQIRAAAAGAASGTLRQVQHQRVSIVQLQRAAAGAASGAASAAAQYQVADVRQIRAAAAGAGAGSVVQVQQVNVVQIQVIAGSAAGGALSQHQTANVVQIQSAAQGASEGSLARTQRQAVTVEQVQIVTERAAADTAGAAAETGVEDEEAVSKHARGSAESPEDDEDDAEPDDDEDGADVSVRQSLFVSVEAETLFVANPNDENATVTVSGEFDGQQRTVTVEAGQSTTIALDPGTYTVTAETAVGEDVELAGQSSVTLSVGDQLQSLTTSVENRTLEVRNPNDQRVTVFVDRDGAPLAPFDVPPNWETTSYLEPGTYAATAVAQDGRTVPVDGEDSAEFTVEAEELYLGVTVVDGRLHVENPTDADVTLTATNDTGAEATIDVAAGASANRTLAPGDYTVTGDAGDDRPVFLNGQEQLAVEIEGAAEPPAPPMAIDLNVTVDEQNVTAEGQNVTVANPSDANVTVTAAPDDGLNQTIAVPAGANVTQTLEPGNYTLTAEATGESENRSVTLDGQEQLTIAIAEPDTGPDDGEPGVGPVAGQIDSCTVVDEPGTYELIDDVAEQNETACIEVNASDVVLDGNDSAVSGGGSEGVGVQVYDPERDAVDEDVTNLTIRNLRVEGWARGVALGADELDAHGVDVALENVTAVENDGVGVDLARTTGRVENVTASRNGEDGVRLWESNLSVNGTTLAANGDDGLDASLRVDESRFANVTATDNGDRGVEMGTEVRDNQFSDLYVADNAAAGISLPVESGGNTIADALVEDNGAPGVTHAGVGTGDDLVNVTVRDNGDWEVDASGAGLVLNATELFVGDAAEVAFEEEAVALDDVEQEALAALPENATAVGDGLNASNVGTVEAVLEYDAAAANETDVELWRHDGTAWTDVTNVSVDAATGTVDADLAADGVYAPVEVIEEDQNATVPEPVAPDDETTPEPTVPENETTEPTGPDDDSTLPPIEPGNETTTEPPAPENETPPESIVPGNETPPAPTEPENETTPGTAGP